MFGNNPIRPPEKGDGSELYLQDIFPTFQGEGIYSGHPAVFIRLGGCNLACDFCDTEFESFSLWKTDDIIKKTDELKGKASLVVITGGEPLRQPISELCRQLVAKNYTVQIETNGTLFRELDEKVKIICSPKNTGSGYHRIREDLLARISAFKFIISAKNKSYQNVVEVGQSDYNIPVYVQPMDENDAKQNKENMDRTVKLALENGYIFSLQTHKIAGVE